MHWLHTATLLTGNTKDKIISELDKIQQEVREHVEDSRDAVDGVGRDVQRLESFLLVEIGDCRRSGDGLEKRLSKLEGVCGRLDGVSDSIAKLNQGNSRQSAQLLSSGGEFRSQQADCREPPSKTNM